VSRRFAARDLVETYPGEVYVPDNVVAIAGLALLRRCLHEPPDRQVQAFLARLRARHLDATTGVFVFAPGQPGRGSGAAWTAYFLSFVDPALSRQQFDRLFEHFGVALPGGALALREWPRGVERGGDVDSGPLVFGLSPSATGFALAGAALLDDEDRLRRLKRTAEAAGVSSGGRYLFAPLVGDAIVTATASATPWWD
jgi:hypothetical protein